MGLFNTTCPIPIEETLSSNIAEPITGTLTYQALIAYISFGSTIYVAVVCSYLALTHLLHYVRVREQRQIIRLTFYPFVLAIFHTLAIYSYPNSIYLLPVGQLIEPISLAALFFLFVEFAEPEPDEREQYFRNLELRVLQGRKPITLPGGSLRWFQVLQ